MRVSRLLWLALVVGLFCLPLFAGLGRTDLLNDEAIYSYAAQSVLETGDWLNPRSSPDPGVVFLEKPPLKVWMVALPIRLGLLPNDEFGLRFWDAVCGGALFLYVFALGTRLAGPLCGFVAAFVLFTFDPLIAEHGLRSNNMEAPLSLAYAGGVYHYLRWSEEESEGRATRHAIAAALYFFLGFMTKFVAVAFLPLVLGSASLLFARTRARLLRGWRAWLAGAALVAALAAPWFIYETVQTGWGVWRIMLAEHVVQRFRTYLDPSHVQPWSYYFTFIFRQLQLQHAAGLVLAGAVLMVLRAWRTRWIDGTFVLVWFALPLTLISFGSSKLGHYSYPYLAPVALAAGYFLASILNLVADTAAGRSPQWLRRVLAPATDTRTWAASRQLVAAARSKTSLFLARHAVAAWALAAVRMALAALALSWLVFAVIGLVHPGRVAIGRFVIARNPIPGRLALNALLLGVVAGYGRLAVQVALPVLLLTYGPVAPYHGNVARLGVERHPLRTARQCILEVREEQRRAGRAPGGVYAFVPNDFLHPYFFYFRDAGWQWRDRLGDEEFASMMDPARTPRPILLPDAEYHRLWNRYLRPGMRSPERVSLGHVLLLLPGPFARCAPDTVP